MIETDSLNNNVEMKPSSLLIEEYLERQESTRELYIHKAVDSETPSNTLWESNTSVPKQVLNINLIVGGWI